MKVKRWKLKSLLKAYIGYWEWDIGQNVFFWSDEAYEIFEATAQSVSIDFQKFLTLVAEKDRLHFLSDISVAVISKAPIESKIDIVSYQGNVKHIVFKARFVKTFDKSLKLRGLIKDLTIENHIKNFRLYYSSKASMN